MTTRQRFACPASGPCRAIRCAKGRARSDSPTSHNTNVCVGEPKAFPKRVRFVHKQAHRSPHFGRQGAHVRMRACHAPPRRPRQRAAPEWSCVPVHRCTCPTRIRNGLGNGPSCGAAMPSAPSAGKNLTGRGGASLPARLALVHAAQHSPRPVSTACTRRSAARSSTPARGYACAERTRWEPRRCAALSGKRRSRWPHSIGLSHHRPSAA